MIINEVSPATKKRPVTPSTILSAKLTQLKTSLQDGAATPTVLALLEECQALVQPLEDYLLSSSTAPSKALEELEQKTNALDWSHAFEQEETALALEKEMLSGAVEGQFLKLLTNITQAKRVLEIGSFTGYASLAIAEALPAEGQLIACEYDPFTAQFAQQYLQQVPHGEKVKILVGDAQESLQTLAEQGQPFDLVFLDADKENYHTYYQAILINNLIQKGGIIVVDNTLYMGQAYGAGELTANGKAIQKFNQEVAADPRVEQVLLPLRDGVTIIRRVS